MIPISDAALAHKMQVYEQVKLFGEQVIAATSSTWSTYLGTAAGALNLVFNIPAARVPAAIIGVVLGLTDFTLNKIVLGLMPARISSLDLAVANPTPKPGEATNATLDLEVVNDPPQIGIQDVTSALAGSRRPRRSGQRRPKPRRRLLLLERDAGPGRRLRSPAPRAQPRHQHRPRCPTRPGGPRSPTATSSP
ncbi:MAG: hypothetical protein U0R69_04185 [Gaiellales bacterium]